MTMSMRTGLSRRLLPLHLGIAAQGFILWLPVEKLFMSEIGFDPAAVGLMAAAYAAVVPLVEVPSGILADRWSRRGVLVVSSLALLTCALVGGLSNTVASYIAATLALGVYFAMFSGTLDAMVYDTVLEETGDSGDFERRLGRVRFVESVALVGSSLAGGWLASELSTRSTYFLSIPFAALSIAAYLRFREPRLHRAAAPLSLRQHVRTTFGALTSRRALLPIIALAVIGAALTQTVFEFGPLWLVALAVPAVLYGPYWAALMSTLGIGGLLVERLHLERPARLFTATTLIVLACGTLTVSRNFLVVTAAQIVVALLLVGIGIHVTKLLHDATPSAVRAGVASGVSSLTWLVFLPFSLVFGLVSDAYGVHRAGLLLIGAGIAVGVLLAVVLRRPAVKANEPAQLSLVA